MKPKANRRRPGRGSLTSPASPSRAVSPTFLISEAAPAKGVPLNRTELAFGCVFFPRQYSMSSLVLQQARKLR